MTTDRMALLESRFDGLHEGVEVMKYEIQRDMVVIMEKLNFMRTKLGT